VDTGGAVECWEHKVLLLILWHSWTGRWMARVQPTADSEARVDARGADGWQEDGLLLLLILRRKWMGRWMGAGSACR